MPRLSSLIHAVIPLACTLCTLLLDNLRFLGLCLRPSPALAAEHRRCQINASCGAHQAERWERALSFVPYTAMVELVISRQAWNRCRIS
jgi:hypothetical protein